jgi:hypothetical protein
MQRVMGNEEHRSDNADEEGREDQQGTSHDERYRG